MLRRLFLSFTLALLFALGQQGAAVHAVSHLANWKAQQQDKAHASSSCDQCVVYAKLSSALGSGKFLPVLASQTAPEYFETGRSAQSSFLRAYTARAPPSLA